MGLVWTPWPLATLQAGVSKGLPVHLACVGGVGLMGSAAPAGSDFLASERQQSSSD